MAIKDFYVQTREVSFGQGGSFTVEGISFDHLARLFTEAKDDMLQAMDLYDGLAESGEVKTEALIMAMLQQVPDLVARIICLAANEPGAEANVRKMPFPVQTEALMAIADLTFVEADALKKFLGHLTVLLNGVTSLKAPPSSEAGSGG